MKIAVLFAPLIYIVALFFALCWLAHICGPFEFLLSLASRISP